MAVLDLSPATAPVTIRCYGWCTKTDDHHVGELGAIAALQRQCPMLVIGDVLVSGLIPDLGNATITGTFCPVII